MRVMPPAASAVLVRFRATLRRHRVTACVVAVLVVAAAVAPAVIGALGDTSPPAVGYANVDTKFKVCLLDTAHGAADPATVWQAVRAATAKAPINAQHLSVPGGAGADPGPYLNSLVALRCQLVITNGTGLAEAVRATGTDNPRTQFLTIGDRVDLANVRTISTPIAGPGAITDAVLAAQRKQH